MFLCHLLLVEGSVKAGNFLNCSSLCCADPFQCLACHMYSVNIFEQIKESLVIELEDFMCYDAKSRFFGKHLFL